MRVEVRRFFYEHYQYRTYRQSVWGEAPGGTPPAPSFPPFLREEMGAPAAQARPRGAPITAGDHRSPLHRRPKLRIIRFRVNAKAHSLRWASSPHDDHSVGSPRGPIGPAPRGGTPDEQRATTGRPYRWSKHSPGKSRADDIRPYRAGSSRPRSCSPLLLQHSTPCGAGDQLGIPGQIPGLVCPMGRRSRLMGAQVRIKSARRK